MLSEKGPGAFWRTRDVGDTHFATITAARLLMPTMTHAPKGPLGRPLRVPGRRAPSQIDR